MKNKPVLLMLTVIFILLAGCNQPGEKQEIIVGDEEAPATEEKEEKE